MKFGKFAFVYVLMFLTIVSGANAHSLGTQGHDQSNAEAQLPDTETGRRFAAYIKAFNSGDPNVMRDFLANNVPKEALDRRPIADRLQVYGQMRENLQSLSVRRIIQATDSSITAFVQSGKGEPLTLTFDCEANSPHMLLGIRIEQGEPPADPQAANPANQTKLTEAEALASVETLLNDLVKKDEFSGVALIAKDGKPIFEKAFGLASKEYSVPNRIDTKFNLGSINKIVTQIALAQLIEQNKLSLDDHLEKFLPDYPNHDAAAKVTIRQLLTMTSGIGDFFGSEYQDTPKNRIRNLKDYLPFFAAKPLKFEPGTGEEYSNGGYVVLGLIIEKITGGSYYDYVREHVFRPTDMRNTDYFDADVPVENMASGYTKNDDRGDEQKLRRNNIYTRPAKGSSAGGGYSTIEDMLKFANALRERKLKFPDFSKPSASGKQERAGMIPGGPDGLGVAGGAPGLNAELDTGVAGQYTIIVMSNYDPPTALNAGKGIRQLLSRTVK